MSLEHLDALLSEAATRFPVEKAAAEVKPYLTLGLKEPGRLPDLAGWLKERGFEYLDMVTAVDWKGPVDVGGYIRDPNPNVFLPEGATPEADAPVANPAVAYGERFELVYAFSRFEPPAKLFLKLQVPRQAPELPSLRGLFKTADWQEREVFDLLGVRFLGHPNLKKILTPDFISGYPLRKDYVHQADRFD